MHNVVWGCAEILPLHGSESRGNKTTETNYLFFVLIWSGGSSTTLWVQRPLLWTQFNWEGPTKEEGNWAKVERDSEHSGPCTG